MPLLVLALVTATVIQSAIGKVALIVAPDSTTTIRVHGYIYDSLSGTQQGMPVEAKLVFESLPYGSEIGIVKSADTSGYYEYTMNQDASYKVSVSSENYKTHVEVVNPVATANARIVRKDFYLLPEVRENQVIRLKNLIFEQGKSNITVDSYGELDRFIAMMEEYPRMEVQLEGHTDYRGSKRLNLQLSEERVNSVKSYLVGHGVEEKRIRTKAFGGSKPLTREKSIEASDINRRVEVRILKLK